MKIFMGEYDHQIDEKNRIRIPSKLKDKIDGGYVISKGTDKCLYVFTSEYVEEKLAAKLENVPMSDLAASSPSRMIFSSMSECEEDKQGRFVIPAKLVAYAEIKKNLITIGAGTHIEIWSEENYNAYIEKQQSFNEEIVKLKEYGV